MNTHDNILCIEKFKLRKFLEVQGYQWLEDKNGKVRVWIRKAVGQPQKQQKQNHSEFSGFSFPEK